MGERLRRLLRLTSEGPSDSEPTTALGRLLFGTLDALTHPLYVIDAHTYRVVLANGASKLDPYSHELTCHRVTHGLPRPCSEYGLACPLRQVLDTGLPATADHIHFDPEGGARICEVHAYPIAEAGGQVHHIIEYNLDMTEQRNAQEQLRLLGTAIESAANAIFVVDREGLIEWVNGAFSHLFGYSRAEVVGRHPSFLRSGMHDEDLYERLWKNITSGKVWRGRMVHRHKNGSPVVVQQTITPLASQKGEPAHFVVVQDDVTSLERTAQRLEHARQFDPLTGLPNRKSFVERIEHEQLDASADELMVMAVDLDHFREFNETFGRAAGDALLRTVGERLALCLGDRGFLARTGGDEFGICQRPTKPAPDFERMGECLISVLSEPLVIEDRQLGPTATVGIAIGSSGDGDSLLQKAEIALSRARVEGRSRLRVYTPDQDEESRNRMELAFDLRAALAREELFLEYQPKVDLESGAMIGVEALLRWNHPRFGLVSPSDFIDAVERIRLSEPITEWVLRSACEAAQEWRTLAPKSLGLAVNMAPSELLRRDLSVRVGRILAEVGHPALGLELEVTEREFMLTTPSVLDNVRELRSMGVRIAIDDFGAGSSSFEFLRRIPVQTLKVAPHFVRNVCTDPGDRAIVRSLVGLAQSLGMDHVIEGVENEEQLELLRADRCRVGQGFHLCPPVPPSEISRILTEDNGQPLRCGPRNRGPLPPP